MTAIVDLSDMFFFLTLIIKRVVQAPLIFLTTLTIDLDPTVQIPLIAYFTGCETNDIVFGLRGFLVF